MHETADVVICGAGIAGAATAFQLAVRHGFKRVVLVDEREALTLTSDKGTQGYRNWWPGPDDTMLRVVSRSIDLLEDYARENGNCFRLNRRGYVFITGDEAQIAPLRATAAEVSAFGMGPVREHPGSTPYVPAPAEGFLDQPLGADLLLGDEVHRAFPYLAPNAVAALHVRRAGTMNAVVLGDWFIKRALAHDATYVHDRVVGVDTKGGRVSAVRLASGRSIATERFVIAAGPAAHEVGRMLDLELPVYHELHAKVTFRDARHVVPRNAPFLIWNDPMHLEWNDAERRELERDPHGRQLLGEMPGGVHLRTVDVTHGDELYLIWTYETDAKPYVWPPHFNAYHAEAALRGITRMIPGMQQYVGTGVTGTVDGGYYCKTRENRPLVGPLPVEGAYVVAALSGIGLMSAAAFSELVSLHVAGRPLPDYASAFLVSRYEDPEYVAKIGRWNALMGQL